MKIKEFIQTNWLFSVWLAFSLLSFISCAITHPILHSQIDNVNLVEVSCSSISRKTDGDIYGSAAIYPERPNTVEFTFDGHLNCKDFMYLTSSKNNGPRPLIISVSYSGSQFDCALDSYVDPKESRNFKFTCDITKGDNLFDRYWNSTQSFSSCSVHVKQATISLQFGGSFFSIYYMITTLAAVCLLGALGGALIVGIIMLIVRGYMALPWFIKFVLWVFLFPVLIFIVGGATGEGNVINNPNKIYDDDGKVVGFYDEKTRTYRDKTGRIRSPGWWKKH